MNNLRAYAWMVVAGLALSISPLITKEIHLGITETKVVTRAEALESGALYLLGALGVLLLVGVILSAKGNSKGKLICKTWAALYGLVMVPFVYFRFGIQDPLAIVAMVAFALAWYYWGSKTIERANA